MGKVLDEAKKEISKEIQIHIGKIESFEVDLSIKPLQNIEEKEHLMGEI